MLTYHLNHTRDGATVEVVDEREQVVLEFELTTVRRLTRVPVVSGVDITIRRPADDVPIDIHLP